MNYDELEIKQPKQSEDYEQCSDFVTRTIEKIIQEAVDKRKNQIIINTNLKLGLPMENINKIGGPIVEAWAFETFYNISEDNGNKYNLINVEAQQRLHMADVVLQFKKERASETGVTSEVDVKATSEDFQSSGRAPNITSFARIRSAFVQDPDYMFIILSLKYKVYSKRNPKTGLIDGIMEIVSHNAYDLKYLSDSDICFNPSLGTGQIQVRDIHYVKIKKRTTWELCKLLDRKYIDSQKGFDQWLKLAKKNGWVKIDE
ncbi:Type-2 restriction enzyme HpaI [Sedimentisphaera cyanobacteriorum]|uniref:Type-2 restriction enzyme HpaI n=1 Tax=Sedimentisphaera cyanobacteriorum TaxID=1940790 RepID=A0A1Q2HSA2_9BACT|nr:restriction endonuclease [Sedimentisphaera cyanobacteriorum]AQQ10115.1 Type-2 restriction enzyme HpaI [Sedimentisphaera cyanobacteriorum]